MVLHCILYNVIIISVNENVLRDCYRIGEAIVFWGKMTSSYEFYFIAGCPFLFIRKLYMSEESIKITAKSLGVSLGFTFSIECVNI